MMQSIVSQSKTRLTELNSWATRKPSYMVMLKSIFLLMGIWIAHSKASADTFEQAFCADFFLPFGWTLEWYQWTISSVFTVSEVAKLLQSGWDFQLLPNPHTLGWVLILVKCSQTPCLVWKPQCMHEAVRSTRLFCCPSIIFKKHLSPFNFFRIFVKNQFTVYTSVYSELLPALMKLPLCTC